MPLCRLIHSASVFWNLIILILLQAHLEDDSISYLESTVHYSHILPAKEKGDDDEERAEQPEDAPMGDDFSPPGYLQVRLEGRARVFYDLSRR